MGVVFEKRASVESRARGSCRRLRRGTDSSGSRPVRQKERLFQPLEREGKAGKLLKLDLVRLDAQHGGSLRLGDVVSEAPLGQKNACDGEFIGDSLTQNGVELPDVEERLFRVDIDPGEGRRLDGVVFVELVERELQLSGRILAADTAAGSVHPIEDVQQRRLIRAVGRYLIPEGEGCTGLQSRDFAVQLEKTTPTATTTATSTTAKVTKSGLTRFLEMPSARPPVIDSMIIAYEQVDEMSSRNLTLSDGQRILSDTSHIR